MSRPNNTTESLLTGLAPDEDTGWQWMRKLHELGYAINVVEPIVFFRGSEYVTHELRKGVVVWRAGYQGAVKADVVFPDPVAAAVWWETERENAAPTPMSGMPKVPAQQVPAWPLPATGVGIGVQQLPPQIGIPAVYTNDYGKP